MLKLVIQDKPEYHLEREDIHHVRSTGQNKRRRRIDNRNREKGGSQKY